jgi:integrase
MKLNVSKRGFKRGSKLHLHGYINGKRLRVSLGTANEYAAADLKRNIENAISRGGDSQFWPELRRLLPPQSFQTLARIAGYKEPIETIPLSWSDLRAAYALRLRQRIELGKMAESTRQRYQHTVKSFEAFLAERGVYELLKIDRPFMEAYKVWRHAKIKEKKFSRDGRGLLLDVAILHGVFAVAVESEMILKNPVRMEGRPGDHPDAGAQPFTADALAKLREFADPDRLAFLLLRWTGLRGSDAVNLSWIEVSLERKEIERITQKRRKRVIIPFSDELKFALEAQYMRVQPRPTDRVLVNPATLKPMTRPRLYQRMRALGKRAGVADVHPHRFRDTLAVDMLEKGASPYDVAKTLGDTIATVEKHYAPFTKELRDRVRKIMETGEGLEKSLGAIWSHQAAPGRKPN